MREERPKRKNVLETARELDWGQTYRLVTGWSNENYIVGMGENFLQLQHEFILDASFSVEARMSALYILSSNHHHMICPEELKENLGISTNKWKQVKKELERMRLNWTECSSYG